MLSILRFLCGRLPFVLLLALVTLLAAILTIYVYGMQSTVPGGLTVSGWKAGGLKFEQFSSQLHFHADHLNIRQVEIASGLKGVGGAVFKLGEIGLRTNVEQIERQVVALKQGSVMERAKKRFQMRKRNLEFAVDFDHETLAQAVDQHWPQMQRSHPVPAQRIITSGDQVAYKAEQNAYHADVAQLKIELQQQLQRSMKSLAEPPETLRVTLPVQVVKPQVTLEVLKAQGIERKIGQFTTVFRSRGTGRVHNIQSTAKTIHDMVLAPGEVFDYDKIIKETRKKYGYEKAPVIFNGNIVPGIGGGICQVSTTLYNAILRTGMEVVERRNHSLPINYVPKGQDATFSEGYINFKFRNNSGKYLLIRTHSDQNRLTVKLFGSMPNNVSYSIESKIVKTINPLVKYVKNSSLAPGRGKVLQQGKKGYIVETYRYKKIDGITVGEELVSRDIYKSKPRIVAINRNGSNVKGEEYEEQPVEPEHNIVEDGIEGPIFD